MNRNRGMRRVTGLMLALVCAVGITSCDKSSKSDEKATSSSTSASGTTTTADVSSFKMIPSYEPATKYADAKNLIEKVDLLEVLANNVNKYLILPYNVPLTGKECGVVNAFWSSKTKSITMCYEFVSTINKLFKQANDRDPANSTIDTMAGVFFHELGHAVIAMYDLPALGREEDSADQLSAVLLLNQKDPELQKMALNYARAWGLLSSDEMANDRTFADEHSLSKVRYFNVLCWIYGSDPNGVGRQVVNKLPAERAARCVDEYKKIQNAWWSLLKPHVKGAN